MTNITRPVPSGKSSLSSLQGSSNVGTAGAGVGLASQQLGAVMNAIGSNYLQKAQAAMSTAVYDNAMSTAKKQFNEQYQDRRNTPFDKNEQPNFDSLPQDTQDIGNSVLKKTSSILLDSTARQQFNRDFSNFIDKSVISSNSVARSQKLDYTRAQAASGTRDFLVNVADIDISEFPRALDEFRKTQQSYLDAGAISNQEFENNLSSTTTSAYKAKYSQLIDGSPIVMREVLETGDASVLGLDSLGLKASDRVKLLDIANSKIEDNIRTENREIKEKEKLFKDRQNHNFSNASKDVAARMLGDSDIHRMEDSNEISEQQADTLSRDLKRIEFISDGKLDISTTISNRLQHNLPTYDISPAKLSEHYSQQIKSLEDVGPKLTLQQEAGIAEQYKAAIKPIQKKIAYQAEFGTAEESEDAIRSWKYLIDKSPITLDGMDSTSNNILAYAQSILGSTGLDDSQAMKIARDKILNVSPDIRAENQVELNLKKNKFGGDRFIFTKGNINSMATNYWFNIDLAPGVLHSMNRLFDQNFLLTGDKDASIEMTKSQTASTFGATSLNGKSEVLMFLAPETMFPDIPVPILKKDLNDSIKGLIPEGKEPIIQSDKFTRSKQGILSWSVSYLGENGIEQLVYTKDGTPARWEMNNEIGIKLTNKTIKSTVEKTSKKTKEEVVSSRNKALRDFKEEHEQFSELGRNL